MIKSARTSLVAGFDIGPGFHADGEFVPVQKDGPITTVVDALRWEPVTKSAAWTTVPSTLKNQMVTLAAVDLAGRELEALIRGVEEDTLLNVAWAESKSGPNPDVIGWAIANVWDNVQGSEGVILVFLHPDYNNQKVHAALTAKLLESLSVDGRPDIVNSETVMNVSKRDKGLLEFLLDQGFETVHSILP